MGKFNIETLIKKTLNTENHKIKDIRSNRDQTLAEITFYNDDRFILEFSQDEKLQIKSVVYNVVVDRFMYPFFQLAELILICIKKQLEIEELKKAQGEKENFQEIVKKIHEGLIISD